MIEIRNILPGGGEEKKKKRVTFPPPIISSERNSEHKYLKHYRKNSSPRIYPGGGSSCVAVYRAEKQEAALARSNFI